MDAYANANDVEKTIQVYKKMKEEEGLEPDIYSYSTLIKAFIQSNQLEDAFIIFDKMKHSDMIPTQPIFSKIISGCIQANKIDRAWQVFDSMRLSYHQPDEVSFTLMLQACAKVYIYKYSPDLDEIFFIDMCRENRFGIFFIYVL